MASLTKDRRGNPVIQFNINPGDPRKTIRLGGVSMTSARTIRDHVGHLVAAKRMGQAPPPHVARWVGDQPDTLHRKLVDVELVDPREPKRATALGAFLDKYVAERVDVKPATKEVWGQTVRNLKAHYGPDRDMATINEGDADGFKLYLAGQDLAPTTVSKRLQFARGFFRAAMRRKLVASNPFAEVSAKAAPNADRQHYVSREETERLLGACDPTWRVIVALARYGGLRCPSEVLSVRWTDVDWAASRLVVTSPKTAHHEGKGSRVIPLYPELRAELDTAYAAAPEGAEYIVDSTYRAKANTAGGWRNCNMRTQFERIIKRAGLVPWPRLFHALRGSRETELAKEYPLHVVTAWMGNTPRIAMRHYLMTTDADFERAASAANSAAIPTRTSAHGGVSETVPPDEKYGNSRQCPTVPISVQSFSGEDRIRTCGRV